MNIRAYKPRDRGAVTELWSKQLNDGSPHNEPAKVIREKQRVQPELFFVGELDGEIIATCMAGYDGHRGWLYSVAVDPVHQRRGFGRRIVEHAISVLQALGCPKVNLQIRAENHAVEAFYQALGFSPEPRISMGRVL